MEFKKLQQIGGVAAILEACIYIIAFIIYGAVLVYPNHNASAAEELEFLSDNYFLLSALNLISYVLFGILLSVLSLAIHNKLKNNSPMLSNLAFIFGIVWVGLVIASGMIANIGLNTVVDAGSQNQENAMTIWASISVVTEGLGGGNEIVGGIWVLLISLIGLKQQQFSKAMNILGIIVGVAGILTVYPLELFTEIFGLGQILWFIWIGISMIRKPMNEIIPT